MPLDAANMSAHEYVRGLDHLGRTPLTGALILGISARQSLRYASGEARVPETVGRLLVALLRLSTRPRPWPQFKLDLRD
jgi:hypothetical protein